MAHHELDCHFLSFFDVAENRSCFDAIDTNENSPKKWDKNTFEWNVRYRLSAGGGRGCVSIVTLSLMVAINTIRR